MNWMENCTLINESKHDMLALISLPNLSKWFLKILVKSRKFLPMNALAKKKRLKGCTSRLLKSRVYKLMTKSINF
jgi:hypothetical protein